MTIGAKVRRLMDMPIGGNAGLDQPLFDLANSIIFDPQSNESQKLLATRRIDEAMGLETPEAELRDSLREYMADHEGSGDSTSIHG